MKRIIAGLMVFLTAALLSNPANAQPHKPGHKHYHKKEQHRIHHGVKTGQLTRREAAHLQTQQAQIRHDKKIARADGIVTPRERAFLQGEQAMASRNIYHKKHNGRCRF